ncbi:dihydrofolate synthase / folylpolyglutamate synthase [Phycisphaerales bacterium]|nr:dihydrofolate synthase / folylpolyglutamate synthase [Phycisphaerales bacterium]
MAAKKPKSPVTSAGGDVAKPRKAGSKMFAGFEEASNYLRARFNVEAVRPSHVDSGTTFRLDRMTALLERVGNPQSSFKSVHVAGSKGKGSVCEMAASCLEACGFTTGLYTSPHLIEVSERIRISQRRISPEEFVTHLGRAAAAATEVAKPHGEATYFELLTAVAFLHFAEQAVDIAIIECGLGGRNDATNVIVPEVSALTAIQLEHTQLLGSTLEEIALQKAGILKPGVQAVSVPQPASVAKVFKDEAARVGAPIGFLGDEIDYSYRFESTPDRGPHTRVVVTTKRSQFEHLAVPLKGEHQAANCGLALAILDRLRERGLETPEALVARGLERTPANGRLELVHSRPRVLVDGAHNPESIQALVRAVGAQVRYDSMVCVFGCAADKDIAGMLQALSMGADKVIFTRASESTRAADPRELNRKFADQFGKVAQTTTTVKDALNLAARAVTRDDLIIVTGSFLVAGEAKRLLMEKAGQARADATIDPNLREVKPSAIAPRPGDAPQSRSSNADAR